MPEPLPSPAPAMRRASQARARDKQEKLLGAALTLVAERGFEDVKMSDITARADCAVGTAYYLFGNKEGLFQALKERFTEEMNAKIDALGERPELASAPLADVMGEIVHGILADLRANEGVLRAALARSANAPDEWLSFRDLVQRLQHRLAGELGPRLKEIAHPDPRLALGFALQLIFSTAANTLLNDPGPLHLHDSALERELTRMACAYLGL